MKRGGMNLNDLQLVGPGNNKDFNLNQDSQEDEGQDFEGDDFDDDFGDDYFDDDFQENGQEDGDAKGFMNQHIGSQGLKQLGLDLNQQFASQEDDDQSGDQDELQDQNYEDDGDDQYYEESQGVSQEQQIIGLED